MVIPCVPLLLEWGCKVTHPIDNSFSIGVLYSGATLFSSLIGEVLTKIVNTNDNQPTKLINYTHIYIYNNVLDIML